MLLIRCASGGRERSLLGEKGDIKKPGFAEITGFLGWKGFLGREKGDRFVIIETGPNSTSYL